MWIRPRWDAARQPCSTARPDFLTVWKTGPYTSGAIHVSIAIVPLALTLTACATPGAAAGPSELGELQAQVRALREENARLEKRLDRIELHATLGTRPPAAPGAPTKLPEPSPDALPALTVVKLKPKQQAAPKLQTATPIVEPSADVVDALKSAQAGPPPAGSEELDPEIGEAFYEQGLAALKTGNVAGGIADLQRFASEAPKHPHADNAIYFSGLGLMGLNDLEGAARAFEDVVTKYPAGDAVLDSLLKLGECRIRLNKPADARVVYQKIVSSYPGTTAATAAKARLSSLTGSP